jgi:hypothetical protein
MPRKKLNVNCPHCASTTALIGPGAGPHAARLTCSECDRFIRWVGKRELAAITALETVFGGLQ